jgi:hypothetical protein
MRGPYTRASRIRGCRRAALVAPGGRFDGPHQLFINPPDLGIAEREIQRVRHGKFVLLPASGKTHGHGTHTWAAFWKDRLVELLAETQRTR